MTADGGPRTPRIRRPGRGRRPLLVAAGTVGALALGLLGYLRFGPGFADSAPAAASAAPSAASRWAAVPTGWQSWQTTVYKTAPRGAAEALAVDSGDPGDVECRRYEDAVYCAGNNILPVRLDGRTGKTVWRADLASAAPDAGLNTFTLLGARDGAVLVRQAVYSGERRELHGHRRRPRRGQRRAAVDPQGERHEHRPGHVR